MLKYVLFAQRGKWPALLLLLELSQHAGAAVLIVRGTVEQISPIPPRGTNRYHFSYRTSADRWQVDVQLLPGSRSSWNGVVGIRTFYDGADTHVLLQTAPPTVSTEWVFSGEQPRVIPGMAGPLWWTYTRLGREPRQGECPAPWPALPAAPGQENDHPRAWFRTVEADKHSHLLHFWDSAVNTTGENHLRQTTPRAELWARFDPEQFLETVPAEAAFTFFLTDTRTGLFTSNVSWLIRVHTETVEVQPTAFIVGDTDHTQRVVLDHRFQDLLTNRQSLPYLASNMLVTTNDPKLRARAAVLARMPDRPVNPLSNGWKYLFQGMLAGLVGFPLLLWWRYHQRSKTKRNPNENDP